MTTRKYSSRSQQTTLTGALTSSGTSATVVSGSALLGGVTISAGETFTVVIDPDTAIEEIVDVTAVSTNTLTITRGADGSSGQAHSAGAVVRHMAIGRDYRESNTHIEASTAVHGLTGTVVGTTDTQTLTNKTINAANNTISNITSAMITDGTLVNADINASAAIAYSKLALTGSITSSDIANDTIVNADISPSAAIARTKIADPTADVSNGGYKITNLGTPTSNTDASTKAYVDTAVANLVDGAPATLDTLNEIAAAIADNSSFSNSVVLKTGSTMSGALAMGTNKITGLGDPTNAQDAATKNYIDTITLAPSNLTGPITSTGSATAIASQTGTGTKFVVDSSPTITSTNTTSASLVVKAVASQTANIQEWQDSTGTVLSRVGNTGINVSTAFTTTGSAASASGVASSFSTTSASRIPVVITGASAQTANLQEWRNSSNTVLVSVTADGTLTASGLKVAQQINAQTGTTYTITLGDHGKYITASNASAITVSIPTNATAAIPVGASIDLIQIGAGQVTVQAASSGTTTIYSTGAASAAPKTRVQYSAMTLKKIATDTWHVIGDIA
jgi:hypothetical protein